MIVPSASILCGILVLRAGSSLNQYSTTYFATSSCNNSLLNEDFVTGRCLELRNGSSVQATCVGLASGLFYPGLQVQLYPSSRFCKGTVVFTVYPMNTCIKGSNALMGSLSFQATCHRQLPYSAGINNPSPPDYQCSNRTNALMTTVSDGTNCQARCMKIYPHCIRPSSLPTGQPKLSSLIEPPKKDKRQSLPAPAPAPPLKLMEVTVTATRTDLRKGTRAHTDSLHRLVFAVRQRNLDHLEATLHAVSDPLNPRYGHYLSRDDVGVLTANPHATAAVIAHLGNMSGVSVLSSTVHGEYVTAVAAVGTWERLLDATFDEYRHSAQEAAAVPGFLRCDRYSLPLALHPHVLCVLNTVQMPMPMKSMRRNTLRSQPFTGVPRAPAAAATATTATTASTSATATTPTTATATTTATAMTTATATAAATATVTIATATAAATATQERVLPQLNCFANNTMSPCQLRHIYNIPSTARGSAAATMGVFESLNQSFSPSDLSLFQSYMGLPQQTVAAVVGDPRHSEGNSYCKTAQGLNSCLESMLDLEYIMGVAPASPATYWYMDQGNDDLFVDWVLAMNAATAIPRVMSVSYSGPEKYVAASHLRTFSIEAIKLGVQGVTLVASSGDDGAAGYEARGTPGNCGYVPQFPACSPYVLAVGATQGLEIDMGKSERACQANTGGVITTGGGFSDFYPRPAYQSAAVNRYFSTAQTAGTLPVSGYNRTGRGYPDVAAAGLNYLTVVGGSAYLLSGTSASAPVVAGLLSLVNAQRLAAGAPTVGFVNPALYLLNMTAVTVTGSGSGSGSGAGSWTVVNDVVAGSNHCVVSSWDPTLPTVCCSQGFFALPGWDPLTGLGTINFSPFLSAMMEIVKPTRRPTLTPTAEPTRSPQSKPTLTTQPTSQPSSQPRCDPSSQPSAAPSAKSRSPAPAPLLRPSYKPRSDPTSQPTKQPRGDPTARPSRQPRGDPTSQPSASPTAPPTRVDFYGCNTTALHLCEACRPPPTFALKDGSLRTACIGRIKTPQPSRTPSATPSRKPMAPVSFRPVRTKTSTTTTTTTTVNLAVVRGRQTITADVGQSLAPGSPLERLMCALTLTSAGFRPADVGTPRLPAFTCAFNQTSIVSHRRRLTSLSLSAVLVYLLQATDVDPAVLTAALTLNAPAMQSALTSAGYGVAVAPATVSDLSLYNPPTSRPTPLLPHNALALAGVVVGGMSVVTMAVLLCMCVVCWRRKRQRQGAEGEGSGQGQGQGQGYGVDFLSVVPVPLLVVDHGLGSERQGQGQGQVQGQDQGQDQGHGVGRQEKSAEMAPATMNHPLPQAYSRPSCI